MKGLPTRSFKSKSHLDRISSSCIRFGEFETLNFSIAVLPEDIALFHALYRTSIKGRKDLVSLMFSDTEDGMKAIDKSYTSRVAEIFNVILKSLGISATFMNKDDEIRAFNDDVIKEHRLDNGHVYFCTDYQFFLIERIEEIKANIAEKYPVITESQMRQMIENELKSRDYINGPMKEVLQELSLSVDKSITDILLEASKRVVVYTDDTNYDVIDIKTNEVIEKPKKKTRKSK